MDVVEIVLEKAKVGKIFKKDAKLVSDHIANLEGDQVTKLETDLNSTGYVMYLYILFGQKN